MGHTKTTGRIIMRIVKIPELFERPFVKHKADGKEIEVPDSVDRLPEEDRELIKGAFTVFNRVNVISSTALEILTNLLASPRKKPREVIITGRIMRKVADLPLKDDGVGSELELEDEEWRFMMDEILFPKDTKGKSADGEKFEKDEFAGFSLNAQSGPLLEAFEDAVKVETKEESDSKDKKTLKLKNKGEEEVTKDS